MFRTALKARLMPDGLNSLPPAQQQPTLRERLLRRLGALMSGGKNDRPPDLDEIWRDFNRKLGGLFGGKSNNPGRRAGDPGGSGGGDSGGPSFQPDMKSAGIGLGLIAGLAAVVWLGSGMYIVQEGHQAVITTFGRYTTTNGAGLNFQWPYPIQSREIVPVTQLRSVDVGRNTMVATTGLRDSSMLTQDENIVDIRFTVQYRLKDARDFLFENFDPANAVLMASESAAREVVGRNKVDQVLYEQRDAIASDIAKSVQAQLDRLKAGVVIANVNMQSVQVPEQVQASFDDAVKAAADGRTLINDGQAYASDVLPKAQGTAARLREQANGYRASVVERASGDANRFRQVYTEYQRAPGVTRDRLYLETMQQVYSNVTKVMVESRSGSNLLYLPLDRLIQSSGAGGGPSPDVVAPAAAAAAPQPSQDPRSRDATRSRERDVR
jgi:modulator of FtsH protease HflK